MVASGKRTGTEEFVKTKVNTYRQFDKDAPQMKIIYTEHSEHHIQRDRPELVIKSIKEIISEVRQKSNK